MNQPGFGFLFCRDDFPSGGADGTVKGLNYGRRRSDSGAAASIIWMISGRKRDEIFAFQLKGSRAENGGNGSCGGHFSGRRLIRDLDLLPKSCLIECSCAMPCGGAYRQVLAWWFLPGK